MFKIHPIKSRITYGYSEIICKLQRPYAQLDHQKFYTFTILAKINPITFKLQLPSTMRIHLVFHVFMLESYQISPLREERPGASPPIEIDDHEEFEVEHVLDSRISQGRLKYLVHWKGYDISNRTWEPAENLQREPIKVREFHKKNPMKPRPKIMTAPCGTRCLRGR
ncbi:hypothetical protein KP509_1Z025500 [Ceratopteris richardii]|nr:hypothetical protein KP509_1Z025500 [Ceratopteris richardii]